MQSGRITATLLGVATWSAHSHLEAAAAQTLPQDKCLSPPSATPGGFCSHGWVCMGLSVVTNTTLRPVWSDLWSAHTEALTSKSAQMDLGVLQNPFPTTVTLSSSGLHTWKWLRETYRLICLEMAFKGSFLSDSSPALSGCAFNAFHISHERL